MIAPPEKLEGDKLEGWKQFIKRTFNEAIDWNGLSPDSSQDVLTNLSNLAIAVVEVEKIWNIDDVIINQELVWFLLNPDVTVNMVVAALNEKRENPLSKLQEAVTINERLVNQLSYQELKALDEIIKILGGAQLKKQAVELDPEYLMNLFSNLEKVKKLIIQGSIKVISEARFALAVKQVAVSARASNYA